MRDKMKHERKTKTKYSKYIHMSYIDEFTR